MQRTSDGGFNFKSNIKVLYKKYKNITAGFKFINQYKNEVLFIKGEKSKYIDAEKLKLSEMFFPDYKLQKIRNAGHWGRVDIGLDVAASEFYDPKTNTYNLSQKTGKNDRILTPD